MVEARLYSIINSYALPFLMGLSNATVIIILMMTQTH